MSFVNLLANDVWSEYDIIRRTEAMIRKEFSLEVETILNRKVLGMTTGSYEATPEDLDEIERYTAVVMEAREAGNAARSDMQLLLKVLEMEKAKARLNKMSLENAIEIVNRPPVEPIFDEETSEFLNEEEVDADIKEKTAAYDTIALYIVNEDPLTVNQIVLQNDIDEREAAQLILDSANEPEQLLYEQRNPTILNITDPLQGEITND